ncbi:MAG: hypothetical protein H6733_00635 [Alphaproteobacteria bacterium]|nr:hypothetical protein [Alphaproteobacteria bacterium]
MNASAPRLARPLVAAGLALCSAPVVVPAVAHAQVLDDEAPPPPVVLRAIPPRFSWDFAFSASYGMLPQFPTYPHWGGFGIRGGWGRHFDAHRVGAAVAVSFEGPVVVQWATNFEPQATWDYVSPKGVYVGASAGVTLGLNVDVGQTLKPRVWFDPGPMIAARIGYSQPWSMVARRFFVAVEPKLRYTAQTFNVGGSIVIGIGRGY